MNRFALSFALFAVIGLANIGNAADKPVHIFIRSEEPTSELQSRRNLVCRLLLDKKKTT